MTYQYIIHQFFNVATLQKWILIAFAINIINYLDETLGAYYKRLNDIYDALSINNLWWTIYHFFTINFFLEFYERRRYSSCILHDVFISDFITSNTKCSDMWNYSEAVWWLHWEILISYILFCWISSHRYFNHELIRIGNFVWYHIHPILFSWVNHKVIRIPSWYDPSCNGEIICDNLQYSSKKSLVEMIANSVLI